MEQRRWNIPITVLYCFGTPTELSGENLSVNRVAETRAFEGSADNLAVAPAGSEAGATT